MKKNISNEEKILIEQFHSIARKKWIKSINKGLGSIGYTFEKELGKVPDSLFFPDYYGIEIKCTGRYSRYPITLFTSSFDGPTFPEINRIIDKYGYPDKDYPSKNVLFTNLSCVKKVFLPSGYQFFLDIDYYEEKIYLCVYDKNGEFIERESFIYFKTLQEHLMLKLNRLAIVYASKKVIDNEKYFRYYKLNIYVLQDFERFLFLLKSDVVKVSLIARISKSGIDIGRHRNKNLVFMIKKGDVDELFDEIYSFNHDLTNL